MNFWLVKIHQGDLKRYLRVQPELFNPVGAKQGNLTARSSPPISTSQTEPHKPHNYYMIPFLQTAARFRVCLCQKSGNHTVLTVPQPSSLHCSSNAADVHNHHNSWCTMIPDRYDISPAVWPNSVEVNEMPSSASSLSPMLCRIVVYLQDDNTILHWAFYSIADHSFATMHVLEHNTWLRFRWRAVHITFCLLKRVKRYVSPSRQLMTAHKYNIVCITCGLWEKSCNFDTKAFEVVNLNFLFTTLSLHCRDHNCSHWPFICFLPTVSALVLSPISDNHTITM